MMVTVAVVAVAVWIGLLGWRSYRSLRLSRQFREEAEVYAQGERITSRKVTDREAQIKEDERKIADAEQQVPRSEGALRIGLDNYSSLLRDLVKLDEPGLARDREEAAHYFALRRHYELLEAKYRRAAIQPWLRVEPDPPRPD